MVKIQYSTVQYSTEQYIIVQYNTVHFSSVHFNKIPNWELGIGETLGLFATLLATSNGVMWAVKLKDTGCNMGSMQGHLSHRITIIPDTTISLPDNKITI